ncbi:MAG: hypothetical protein II295_07360, partial [Akkermansia sp.]|nr:hypothetical protein [Akkermansia sp.]
FFVTFLPNAIFCLRKAKNNVPFTVDKTEKARTNAKFAVFRYRNGNSRLCTSYPTLLIIKLIAVNTPRHCGWG